MASPLCTSSPCSSPQCSSVKRQRLASSKNDDSDDGPVEVMSSTATNPLLMFPHMRHTCAKHPFVLEGGVDRNYNHCPKCFCFVCDVLVSECKMWSGVDGQHCDAHDGCDLWSAKRRSNHYNRNRSPASNCISFEPQSNLEPEGVIDLVSDTSSLENIAEDISNQNFPVLEVDL